MGRARHPRSQGWTTAGGLCGETLAPEGGRGGALALHSNRVVRSSGFRRLLLLVHHLVWLGVEGHNVCGPEERDVPGEEELDAHGVVGFLGEGDVVLDLAF